MARNEKKKVSWIRLVKVSWFMQLNKWKCYWLSYFWIIIYCLSTIPTTRVTKQPQIPIANNFTVWRGYGWYRWPSWVLPTCTTHLYCKKHAEIYIYILCSDSIRFDSHRIWATKFSQREYWYLRAHHNDCNNISGRRKEFDVLAWDS